MNASEGPEVMDNNHKRLLRNIFDGGSVPLGNTVESKRLLNELVDAGLVEIARPDGRLPHGQPPPPEYRLTSKGKAMAESLPRE